MKQHDNEKFESACVCDLICTYSASFRAASKRKIFVQIEPASRDIEEDVGVDTTALRRILHRQTRTLQLLATLLLALDERSLYLVGVERLRVMQTRESKVGGCSHHAILATS